MEKYVIAFRSVTPAQRGRQILAAAGIDCLLMRTPRSLEPRGCGYCLKVSKLHVGQVQALMADAGLTCHVYEDA